MAFFSVKALSGLLNPKVWIWGGGLILAAWLSWNIYGFVDQALEDRQTVVRQEVTIELKEQEIETLEFRITQAEEAQRIAEEARIEAEALEDELRRIRDAAVAAGDERDGELAPVLQDTLRALRNSDN